MSLCKHLLNVLLLLGAATAGQTAGGNYPAGSPDADGKYTISAEGIRAQFIPYGASLTNLFINDTNGIERDIVLGYDNASYYSIDKAHPHLGGVPGIYRVTSLIEVSELTSYRPLCEPHQEQQL